MSRFSAFALSALTIVAAAEPTNVIVRPDAVFVNGKVITVDSRFTVQQGFAVRGDTFFAVGTNERVRKLAGNGTRIIDLHGRTVIPGLGDNHDHVYDSAKVMLRGLDVGSAGSKADALELIRQAVANAPPGQTVFTTALQLPSDQRPITRQELDAISTTVPIVVPRTRRGAASLNIAALHLAGVTRETPVFAGVPVPTDSNGDLTGQTPSSGEAALLLLDRVLPLTDDEEEAFLLKAVRQRAAVGLTSVRDLNLSPRAMRAYVRLRRKGALTLRVGMGLILWDATKVETTLANWGVDAGFGDEWLRVDSISEAPSPVVPGVNRQLFTKVALAANRYGWRLAPHIGTSASLDVALDAYEAADREQPIRDKRWVLEHVPFATSSQMDRIARLGVVVTAQYAGYNEIPVQAQAGTGPAPMRELLDHHVVVSGGSDFVDENGPSDNPFIPIYFFVTRKTRTGAVRDPEQKISRAEALRVSTYNFAYTTFEEARKGSIEPGKLADFVILSDDVLTVPEEQILAIHALATYVGGRQVYTADPRVQ